MVTSSDSGLIAFTEGMDAATKARVSGVSRLYPAPFQTCPAAPICLLFMHTHLQSLCMPQMWMWTRMWRRMWIIVWMHAGLHSLCMPPDLGPSLWIAAAINPLPIEHAVRAMHVLAINACSKWWACLFTWCTPYLSRCPRSADTAT